MRILYAGDLGPGELCRVRCEALEATGVALDRYDFGPYNTRLRKRLILRALKKISRVPFMWGMNRGLLDAFDAAQPDVVYFDKAIDIQPRTLREMRRRATAKGRRLLLVHFHPDDAFHPWDLTSAFERGFLEYDLHMCPHPWVLDEFRSRGVERTLDVPYGFDPKAHFRERRFDAHDASAPDVVFIGRWEKDRAGWIHGLADQGFDVRVWGPGWKGRLEGSKVVRGGGFADFAEQRFVYGTARITLGLLSISNHGGHTTRTFEVPACGGFMLAERTPGQCAFFEEGREIGCFEGPDELAEKVRYFLEHEDEREAMREAGHRRCVESGYDYESRLRDVLHEITRLAEEVGVTQPDAGAAACATIPDRRPEA